MKDRACGACNVCCRQTTIPVLRKLPGVLCAHWALEIGCTIYETRSEPCRGHYCGWRLLPELDEAWRPDLSNVYIRWVEGPVSDFRDQVPEAPSHFILAIVGELDAAQLQKLAAFSAELIRNAVPVFLESPAPPEWVRRRFPLNGLLTPFLPAEPAIFLQAFQMALKASATMPAARASFDADGRLIESPSPTA